MKVIVCGNEVDYKVFEDLRRTVYRYATGRITGRRFEELMRRRGFTRAKAYEIYRCIIEGLYRVIIRFVRVLATASLVTTSSRGASSERYFEGRIFAPVPVKLKDSVLSFDDDIVPKYSCREVDTVGKLLMKCIYIYFESKGYDPPMLEQLESWKGGVRFMEEFEADEDMDIHFECEIYDLGSATRPMSLSRWHDTIEVIRKYWEDLPRACLEFNNRAFEMAYLKEWGKGVRW